MIIDLTVILAAAAISTLIFKRLRQPIVLGYLIAGFAVGPHFSFLPTIVDNEGVKLWAEIGVIFLLFGLGLEFSFKKLAKVGKSASTGAIFEIITMSGVGYLVGRAFGWTSMDSIYLGAILSMSSTTIIIRAFEEAGLKGKGFVNLVFGILIVEDLSAILLMVLLTAISTPGSFSGANILFLTARLGFFLLIWFLVGIYVLPSVLRRIRPLLTSEIMLILSISLCLLMVVLATQSGFSAALGAFVMGSILAETEEGERIEHLLLPVKDLFAAVFFVSVGMMINPSVLREHFGVIAMITVVTVIGKLIGSGFGALLSGRSLKQSVQAGMSLAQIGEFSFIIATLGTTLKATSDFLYPIVVAVSAVTTLTTPYMIRYSDPIYSWIERRLPRKFVELLHRYELAMSIDRKEGALGLLLRVYGLAALVNSVLVVAIGLASHHLLLPALTEVLGDEWYVRLFACVASLTAASPFLLAIALKAPKKLSIEEITTLARLRSLQLGVFALRIVLALGLIAFIISEFARNWILPLVILILAPLLMLTFRHYLQAFYLSVERRFLKNLNAKEMAALQELGLKPVLAPWNATLAESVVSSDSAIAGTTLEESRFRATTGATIAMIDRGQKRIFAPKRSERLLPSDKLYLIGSDEQIAAAQELIERHGAEAQLTRENLYLLDSIAIEEQSPFVGRTIQACGISENLGGLVVGIERAGQRILNPEAALVLQPGDVIWIFAHRDKIRGLKQQPAK
jgi:CPA2 family monovalent cation:H+ antiporter-2